MYQLEVKRWPVEHRFNPSAGWKVLVDIDAMERARGGSHPAGKEERAAIAEARLLELGAQIGAHPQFGRADLVAHHAIHGALVVEVEGTSSRQPEQAMYSALGQVVLLMRGGLEKFALAVPDEPRWERQLLKIPSHVKQVVGLSCLLVSEGGVREVQAA